MATVQASSLPTAEVPTNMTNELQRELSPTKSDFSREGESDNESQRKQDGVKRVEAITTVWSREMLIAMFILLYLVNFVDAMLQSVQGQLIPYITSSFSQHGLLGVTSVVATILGGVWNLTIAKVLDIWGRCEGFLIMLLLVVIGVIMKATCTNVEMYAAGHTFYWVGHLGIGYVTNIILADITSLRNRLILFAINSTPLICSTFAGPRIADLFYDNLNFRWAFGAFLIIQVAICIPVAVIFILSKRKAEKLGLYPPRPKTRTTWESLKHYFFEFDVVGQFLTVSGFSLLLLPFSLVSYDDPDGWKAGHIIAMIVLGVVLLTAFGIWEKWFSPVPYIPFKFLKDRTILGACFLYGIMFCSIFCWDTYYGSYLQVVHDESITTSGYVLNTFSLTSAIIGPFVGIAIRHTGNYKWMSFAAVPFAVLGTALLIHFRTPSSTTGYLVMCQIFNGLYSGVWALTAQLAIMASVSHQEIAVALAMWGLFGSIGASMGYAISGALWTKIFPVQLLERLPEDSKHLVNEIYGDITVQKSYPMGSPIRDAIIGAYADVQRKMVITGVAFIPLCVVCLLLWKNLNVRKLEETKGKQTKGNVW